MRIIKKIFNFFGLSISRVKTNNDFVDIFSREVPANKIISLDNLSSLSNNIKGMITPRAGEELFALAYMQSIQGDVVEIGSFQGKSTYFLGTAVKLSSNGKMYAIDHFKGNVGKENSYKVEKDDLSDLELGFKQNIKKTFLDDTVNLINEPVKDAINKISDNSVRFLFIDGDHTAEGVELDLELFKNKLKSKAIIVFDDYAHTFPGVIEVTNKFIKTKKIVKKYLLDRTLVIELP